MNPDSSPPTGETGPRGADSTATARGRSTEHPREEKPGSPLDGRLARWPLFPYLLCCFTVASFLIPNVRVVPPPQLLPLLLGILAASLAVHTVLYFASRRRTALASLGLLGIVLAFLYEPVIRQVVLLLPGSSWRLPLGPLSMSLGKFLALGACATLPLVGGALGGLLTPRAWRGTCLCLNLLLLGLFLASTASLGAGWYQALAVAASLDAGFTVQEPKGIAPDQYPDIIHIVLDEVPRSDVYRQLSGGEELPMNETMRRWGGQVAQHSSSNLNFTVFSTCCLLNFHLPEIPPPAYGRCYDDAAALRQLRHLGYRVEVRHWAMPALQPWWTPNEYRRLAIEKFWADRSLWGTVMAVRQRNGGSGHSTVASLRQQFEGTVQDIGNLPTDSAHPVYYMAHVIGGHGPYAYDSDGNHVSLGGIASETASPAEKLRLGKENLRGAMGQLHYCWGQYEKALDALMAAKRKRPLLIIVQSDHGFRWNEMWTALAADRGLSSLPLYTRLPYDVKHPAWPAGFASYTAVFASPPLHFSMPESLTVANLFPNVFNQVFGMSIPMREDRYFTGGRTSTDPWVDCTEEVRRLLAPEPSPVE